MKSAADSSLFVSKSLNPLKDKKQENEDILVSAKTFITENKGKFRDCYKIGHVIGSGAYGQVRKCLHIKSNSVRAVKLIPKSIMSERVKSGIIKELEILRTLVHYSIRIIPTS
jgi:serine/threonine protein kinase